MIYLILPPKAEEGWIKPDQCQVNSTLLELHCKYFSCNISGFYACVIISCTIVVLITALGCAQLSDVMNLISCTLFVSIATNRC